MPLPQTAVNKHPAQAGALLASTQTEQSSCNKLFQLDSTNYSSCPLTVPIPLPCVPSWTHGTCPPARTSPKPVLLPPSSFIPRLRCESEMVSFTWQNTEQLELADAQSLLLYYPTFFQDSPPPWLSRPVPLLAPGSAFLIDQVR